MRKNGTHARMDEDVKLKFKDLRRELSLAQGEDIPLKEVFRRTASAVDKFPDLKNLMVQDARNKRRQR